MAKKDFSVRLGSKSECRYLLEKHHYLSKISKGFKSGYNFALLSKSGDVVGVCIYTGFPVPELVKGCFGLDRNDQEGFFELSRLVIDPMVQTSEHNIAGYFLAKSLKALRVKCNVRAVLSYADTDFHKGTVYKATGFSDYGLTAPKKDFFILQGNGAYIKHSRGKTKGVEGEWRNRSQKRRFLKIFDSGLNCLWAVENPTPHSEEAAK